MRALMAYRRPATAITAVLATFIIIGLCQFISGVSASAADTPVAAQTTESPSAARDDAPESVSMAETVTEQPIASSASANLSAGYYGGFTPAYESLSGDLTTAYSSDTITTGNLGLTFTEREIEWLAALIYYEGRGYYSYAKELIAQVAVNRVLNPNFPNTLEGVLKQEGQYGYGWEGYSGTKVFATAWSEIVGNPTVKAECMLAARRVAEGKSTDENGERWPLNVLYQHSYDDPEHLGPLFRSYTDPSGVYTEHFNYG